MTDIEKRTLWVRAGGRCTLCKTYLLEGNISAVEVPLGEGAHIVGKVKSKKSARGLDPLPVDDRDEVDNLMLACASCHNEIDKKKVEDVIDVDVLRDLKRKHEADIKTQTGLLRDKRTAIVRMAGAIRGDLMQLPRTAAAEAVIRSAQRFPHFIEAYDRQGVEVDLLNIDGEHPLDDSYYPAATRRIDAAIDKQVLPGIQAGHINHLSVFAIARLPLLVYLGSKLDDGFPVDIYQRHRATESWEWPNPAAATGFIIKNSGSDVDRDGADPRASEVVLITNLSGTTPTSDLPVGLQTAPTWTIAPDAGPTEDVFASADVLGRFVDTVRAFFTDLEAIGKQVQTVHLFGALPLAGAVAFGRVLKSDGLRPAVVTYDRDGDGYRRALEV